ncbi:hypothetical protein LTR53_007990 [Teratosphaeriaceae sp. CCFEE 6253]|nr:hypothetical protein LTR53_007990 [Teratosphaeriaceae sp. CCFEE 6253]
MSIRVVARIRPLLNAEIERDVIVSAARAPGDADDTQQTSLVRIPNPKNAGEAYTFHFQGVYDRAATQAQLYEAEVAPTVKQLFKGCDVTLFAYGVTGTGKTHTMRGGKSLAERGVIPRLLSSIYRRARKLEKDGGEDTRVSVAMSYYEIYNDRVFDLFEPPEKRTPAGLPIRDTGNGKTQVVGLTERPCTSLKEFELLYDQANVNRSTSATKLNAHSSRSHAVLCVKVTQTTGNATRVSTASAIDLAGSEDNRRTDNKDARMVESASINRSLFVLAQCVEAIGRKQARVPYRESKMTRILALGQNDGVTVMILNLAPVRSYHLDTLSSLNFANRTKKVEVNEVENPPVYRLAPGKSQAEGARLHSLNAAPTLHRQPLRSKVLSQSSHLQDLGAPASKPVKAFAVFTDKPPPRPSHSHSANTSSARHSGAPPRSPGKRTAGDALGPALLGRPSKFARRSDDDGAPPPRPAEPGMSTAAIEALVARKVAEALAERADCTTALIPEPVLPLDEVVQRRLDALEKRIAGQETERGEGLRLLVRGKEMQGRGEEGAALEMYTRALEFFPGNEKLGRKVLALQSRLARTRAEERRPGSGGLGVEPRAAAVVDGVEGTQRPTARRKAVVVEEEEEDDSYHDALGSAPVDAGDEDDDEEAFAYRPRTKLRRPGPGRRSATASLPEVAVSHPPPPDEPDDEENGIASADGRAHALATAQTPRTQHLLHIINTRDVSRIKLLKGVGAKKAEAIVSCLCDLDEEGSGGVRSLGQLGGLRGVGVKGVEKMRVGLGSLVQGVRSGYSRVGSLHCESTEHGLLTRGASGRLRDVSAPAQQSAAAAVQATVVGSVASGCSYAKGSQYRHAELGRSPKIR